jgi:hypothetical protein
MHALRRLARPAIATAAAVLLLSGCGGDDDTSSSSSSDSSSSSSSSTSSSADSSESSSSGDSDVAAFCAQAQEFATALNDVNPSTPADIPPVLQEATAAFDAAEPPAEIESDWAVLGDALHTFADATANADLTSAEGAQQLQQAATDFSTAFSGPEGQNVDAYVTSNCPGA